VCGVRLCIGISQGRELCVELPLVMTMLHPCHAAQSSGLTERPICTDTEIRCSREGRLSRTGSNRVLVV
jgi:hypothetical protein